MKKEMAYGVKNFGNRFIAGLGLTAEGIYGNERIISAELLERDLRIAKAEGVKEVIIYRLGGLNKEYMDVIQKFVF